MEGRPSIDVVYKVPITHPILSVIPRRGCPGWRRETTQTAAGNVAYKTQWI